MTWHYLFLLLLLPLSLAAQQEAGARLAATQKYLEDETLRRVQLDSMEGVLRQLNQGLSNREQAKLNVLWARWYNITQQAGKAWAIGQEALGTISSDWAGLLRLELGTAAFYLKKGEDAQQLLDESRRTLESQARWRPWARANLFLASQYHSMGKAAEALPYLQAIENRSEQIPAAFPIIQRAYDLQGHCLNQLGKVRLGMDYYQKRLNLLLEQPKVDSSLLAQAYSNMGIRYGEMFDLTLAENYLLRAIELNKAMNASGTTIANLYVTLGSIATSQGQHNKAEERYLKAMKALPNPSTSDYWGNWVRIIVVQGYAQHLMQQERYEEATGYMREALERGQYAPQTIGRNWVFASRLYQAKGDLDSALYAIQRAIEMPMTFRNEKSQQAYKYFTLGFIYFQKGELNKALQACQEAEQQLDFYQADGSRALDLRNNPDLNLSYQLLNLKATIQEQQGQLEAALQSVQESVEVMEYHRKGLVEQQVKSSIALEGLSGLYATGLRVSLRLAEQQPKRNYTQMAFQLAERSKANLLSDALQLQAARLSGGLPDSLVALEQRLSEELAQLRQVPDKSSQAQLLAKEKQLRELQELFEKQYADYYQLRYQSQVPDIEALQKNLPENALWINYVFTDTLCWLFTATASDISAHPLANRQVLEPAIRSLRTLLTHQEAYLQHPQKNLTAFQEQAYALYQQLLGPIEEKLRRHSRLFVSADGPLHYLPFEVLLTEQSTAASFAKLPYLLRSHSLSYQYRSEQFIKAPEPPETPLQLLALAPDYAPDSWLGPLPGAQEELSWLENRFEGRFLKGAAANKAAFEAYYAQHQVVHLAMHALVDNEAADQSGLYFDADSGAVLKAFEIPFLTGKNELLVLGACETGYGPLQQGEGLVSLGQHFLYAGSHSLVFSLWKLSDQAQVSIMRYFYEGLEQGLPKDIALQRARLQYLDECDDKQAHPFFWAASIQLGTVDALQLAQRTSRPWYYWAGALLLLGLLGGLIGRRLAKRG